MRAHHDAYGPRQPAPFPTARANHGSTRFLSAARDGTGTPGSNGPASGPYAVLFDPDRDVDFLPLDREPHLQLVQAVLAWDGAEQAPRPGDCEQIGLQLTGHARLVAADVRRLANLLPPDSRARALAEVVLGEADRRLATAPQGTVASAQNRARMLRALYERLDRLGAGPAGPTASSCP